MHADDEGLGGGDGWFRENDIFKLVGTRGKDGCPTVDLGGIEKIENGKVLDLQNFVHALDAKPALAVQEVGDVSLFESSLLGEAESGQFTCFNAVPKNFAEIVLQNFELHWRSIAPGYGADVSCKRSDT